jgi:WD40 repeat protein
MLTATDVARADPFESASELREAHARLLDALDAKLGHDPSAQGEAAALAQLEPEVRQFVQRAAATGAYIEEIAERTACQTLLDYWASSLSRAGMPMGGMRLAPFDREMLPDLKDKLCPYVGLEAFRDPTFFFGREADIKALIAQLHEAPLVIVAGASGSGKSSLVIGGVLPALVAAAAQDGPEGLRIIAPFVPGTAALEYLAEAVLQGQAEQAAGVSVEAAALRRDPGHLHALVGGARARPVLITIDQFEEVFTLSAPAERAALVANLTRLLEAPEGHRVILTVREEFKNRITELMPLSPFFDGAWFSMRPMGYDALRAAVEKPASRQNLQFQSGIVDDLVKKVLGQPAALPLLQFALRSLWNARDRNRITWEVYRKVGDPLNALQDSAERFYGSLAPQTQDEARRILLELVRVDELLEAYRQPVAKGRLLQAGKANTEDVLRLLADHDYVRITPGTGSADALVEVKHEALVRNWPRLVGWIDEKRVQVRQRLAVTQAAHRWAEGGKPEQGLLTGWQLLAAETQPDLSELEKEFVQASAAAIDRAQQAALRRRTRAATAVATAAFLALAAAIFVLFVLIGQNNTITKRDAEIQAQSDEINQQNLEIKEQNAKIIQQNDELKEQAKKIEQQAEERAQLDERRMRALRLQPQNYVNDQRDLALLLSIEAIRRAPGQPELVRNLLSIMTTNIELKSIFPGHVGKVSEVKVSPDKKMIASASYDEVRGEGTIVVRDQRGNMRYAPLKGHHGLITGLAFSPDGKILASASHDKTVILWDVTTGEKVDGPLSDDGAILDVAINKDGTTLASAREDGLVTLWNLKNLKSPKTVLDGGPSRRKQRSVWLAFSPTDRALLASAGSDENENWSIVLWNTMTRKQAPNPIIVKTAVFSMAFSHDGKTIASGNLDGSVKTWDVATRAPRPPGKYLDRPGEDKDGQLNRGVYGIAFSPDDRRLASVSLDRSVYVHYLNQRDREPRRLNGYIKPLRSVDFVDNDTLATGTDNGMVVIWDLGNNYPFEYPVVSADTKATSAHFADDGKTLISHWRNQLQFIPIRRTSTPQGVTARGQPEIRLNLLAPNGEYLVTIGTDNSIALWDVAKRSQIGMPVVPPRKGYILAAAFSADSRTLAVSRRKIEDDDKGEIWLVDVPGGTHKVLATGSDGLVFAMAFSPMGNLLAASEEGSASIWNLDTLKPQSFGLLPSGDETFLSLTFSTDGKLLAAGGTDGAIQLWDVETNSGTLLEAHRGPVSALAFSPDGKQLASGGWDKSIFLWDIKTHQVLTAPIVKHQQAISRIAFTPDGHWMASSADSGELAVWELNTSTLFYRACQVAGRNLTQEEWSRSFGVEDFHITCPVAKAMEADALALSGDRVGAEQLYRAALKAAIEAEEPLTANEVCWLGSLDGFAALVKAACEQAVQLASEVVERDQIRDSRGVARALTGDVAGAAEDFGAFVEFLKKFPNLDDDLHAMLRRRESWIAALKAGRNPFDAQLLKELRFE